MLYHIIHNVIPLFVTVYDTTVYDMFYALRRIRFAHIYGKSRAYSMFDCPVN